jgi:2-hydroxy-3-oxopropionate reductase
MSKVGFIGLGIMGKPMSRNLIKAGYQLVIYDIDKAPVEEFGAGGG